MHKQVECAHFEPMLSNLGPSQGRKGLENGPIWDHRWLKNRSKPWSPKLEALKHVLSLYAVPESPGSNANCIIVGQLSNAKRRQIAKWPKSEVSSTTYYQPGRDMVGQQVYGPLWGFSRGAADLGMKSWTRALQWRADARSPRGVRYSMRSVRTFRTASYQRPASWSRSVVMHSTSPPKVPVPCGAGL